MMNKFQSRFLAYHCHEQKCDPEVQREHVTKGISDNLSIEEIPMGGAVRAGTINSDSDIRGFAALY